ncbi:MAG TPA: SusC/RagA family TonB-linked outer membrane protein [Gemmatimonadaceae bacterium]|nr:SusC/RagA family TonB-linked outer membrane protein [Gemmatimonadaceae bacterium]
MKRLWFMTAAVSALLAAAAPLAAQRSDGTVQGRIVDSTSQQPVVGASVTVGPRTTLTRGDGRYSITVPAGTYTLEARTIGYAPRRQSVTVTAGETVTVDLTLTAQATNLAAIVVTGYGQQRAGDVTGAVSQLTPAEFNPGKIISPQSLIQSKVAGVQVVDNNEPGGGISIRIRGATSVNASSEPLYVVDGMPLGTGAGTGLSDGRDALDFLNPNDIASITVLKGASAAAIYGANAANGVVLITTKAGSGGARVEYTGDVTSSTIERVPQMLDASQFRTAVQQYSPQSVSQLGSANTDWFSQVERNGAGQEHNLAISGSGPAMNYRLSFGYLNQQGVIKGTSAERASLGLNYDQRFLNDRLDIHTNILGSQTVNHYTPGGVLSNAAQMGPTQPIYDPSSTTGFYNWPGNTLQSADNPIEALKLSTDQGHTLRSLGTIQADYSLPWIDGLKAHVDLGYDATSATRRTFNSGAQHAQLKSGEGGSMYWSTPSMTNTLLDTYLDYNAAAWVLPGTIDLTGGYSYSESNAQYPYVSATGLATNLLGINGIPASTVLQANPTIQQSRLISFFGRANYNYEDRYLAAFSIRRDGSSRFGPSQAWGIYPSVALAWRISQEGFMKRFKRLSDLKLRASYGKTGNQAFANYQQYANFVVGDAQSQAQFGNGFVTTIRPSAVDPNIKWESTSSYDLGLDYGFDNQRFSGAIDYYVKNTSDLIFTVPVAAGTNLSNYLTTNIGSMRNAGVEFSLSADVIQGGHSGFSWSTDWTAAHNANKLTAINPILTGAAAKQQQILTGSVAGGVGTLIQVLEPGQPINSFFVYKQNYAGGKPTEGSYADLNGDGQVNVADRRAYHDPAPKWILGHTSNMTYGSWDAAFTLRAYLGNWVYNNIESNLGDYQELQRASPYNLSSNVLVTGFKTPQYLSDYYVQNAEFLRMDNVTVGYRFKYQGRPVRAFGTVQNVFTISPYSGVDPTAGLNGIDNNIYPRSRIFTAGLNVVF